MISQFAKTALLPLTNSLPQHSPAPPSPLHHKSLWITVLRLASSKKLSLDKERAMRVRDQVTPIDVLPDDVLLAIFGFFTFRTSRFEKGIEAWQSLVHVCRRWRCVVFASPRRLNLQLVCTPGTPAMEKSLDIWPTLPLVIEGYISSISEDNNVVAPRHRDRVCRIHLQVNNNSQWDQVMAEMQLPFPALTDLMLRCDDETAVIPDTFLGGSAPRLQYLSVEWISFPGLPNLLLSATHLVYLHIHYIPHSGYISSEAMATCLSVLTSLDTFSFGFLPTQSRPDGESRRPPPMARSVLPDLTNIFFIGASEYFDDLVAGIDAPRLDDLSITFLDQRNFDTPHLVQFISRTPTFQEPPEEVHVGLDFSPNVRLLWASHNRRVEISCEEYELDQKFSSIAQVCNRCLPPLLTMENLRFGVFPVHPNSDRVWKDEVENSQWLELLRPFTAVKNLYVSEDFQPNMGLAIQELVRGRTMEILPSLQNIFFARSEASGPFQEAIGQFVAARQLSDHPIAISVWE